MEPYGCKDHAPFADSTKVQDGFGWMVGRVFRVPKMVDVPFRMSKECNYRHSDLGKSDKRCDGCAHRGDPPQSS